MRQRQCKLAFTVVFVLLLFSTVAFSFAPVNAEELVLDGNTAKYEIVNDANVPWYYNDSDNTWAVDHFSFRSANEYSIFTLNITGAGTVDFKWKLLYNSSNANRLEIKHKKNGGEEETIVAEQSGSVSDMLDWKRVSISVAEGDTITFKSRGIQSSWFGQYAEYVCGAQIQGLKKPENCDFDTSTSTNVTVAATDGGSIAFSGASSDTINAGSESQINVPFGKMLTATAQAQEGYGFVYWLNENGQVISYDSTFAIPYWSSFEKKISAKFLSKSGYEAKLGSGWEDKSSGQYDFANVSSVGQFNNGADLRLDFFGERYFSVEFMLNFASMNELYFYVDDEKLYSFAGKSDNAADTAYYISGNGPYHVKGDTYHYINIHVYGGYKCASAGNDTASIKNIQLKPLSEMALHTVNFEFDENLSDIAVAGESFEKQGSRQFAVNERFEVKATNKEDATSTVDISQTVATTALGIFEEGKNENIGSRFSGTYSGYSTTCYFDDAGKLHYGNSEDKTLEGTTLEIKYQEHAPLPHEISVLVTESNKPREEQPLNNNDSIDLAYGASNTLVFSLTQFKSFADKISFDIKVNGESKPINDEVIMDKYSFTLSDVQVNTDITIVQKIEGFGDSAVFNVHISIRADEQGLQKIVSSSSLPIVVTNDEIYEWYFDPASMGEDETYAYRAGNENSTDYSVRFSQLTFDVSAHTQNEAAQLMFEFYIDGSRYDKYDGTKEYYAKAIYNLNTPITVEEGSYKEKYWYQDEGENHITGHVFAKGNSGETPVIIENNLGAYEALDGKWVRASIAVETGTSKVYIGFADEHNYNYEIDRFMIRNVMLTKGTSNVTWGILDTKGSDGSSLGNLTVKNNQGDAQQGEMSAGTVLTFTANPNEGNSFYYWKNGNKILSYDPTLRFPVGGTAKIEAVMGKKGDYAARRDGEFFDSVKNALNSEKSGDIVIVDDTTISESITIPNNVNLIIPINLNSDYYIKGTNKNAGTRVSWAQGNYQKPVYTVTIANEVKITLNGNLYVGGVLHYPGQYAQGLTSGAYSQLIINGEVEVAQNGHLDVYGRVTGTGSITVKNGGKLSQPFMILDYNGGTNTESMFDAGVTPFKMYAMINVQCTGGYTIEYGGSLYGHASLYFSSSITTLDAAFITSASADGDIKEHALIVMKNGSSVHILYDDTSYDDTSNGQHKHVQMESGNNVQDVGYTQMEISGNACADYMEFPLGIDTANVYFSIPYNHSITLKTGSIFDIAYPYKAMPGSELKVENKATLTVKSGAGLHIYDGFIDPGVAKRSYPTGAQLIEAGYKPYADFSIDGTLKIEDGATFLGTVQTNGTTGRIEIGSDVTLSKDLFDGTSTQYSCSYTSYHLDAHVWDKAHSCLAKLEAGHNYVAVSGDSWTLPSMRFEYETETGGKHDNNHVTTPKDTDQIEGLVGTWMIEHSEHKFDWTKQEGDKVPTWEGSKTETITRVCQEIGCDHKETRKLLYVPNYNSDEFLGMLTYKGKNFGEEDIKTLFETMFGEGIEATYDIKQDILNVGNNYDITITLTNDFWYGETYNSVATVRVKVVPATLTQENAKALTEQTYTGKAINPEPEITFGGKTLNKGADYIVSYGENTNVGKATVTVKGNGNFTGEFSLEFDIAAKDLSEGNLSLGGLSAGNSAEYTGKEIMPNVTFNLEGYSLVAENDYDIEYESNINAGKATVTVRGKGNFSGEKSVEFTITPKSIGGAQVVITGEYVYNRKAHQPTKDKITVTIGDLTLGENDYELSYGTNIEAGNGTVTITAVEHGNYSGSVTKTFVINKAKIESVTVKSTHVYTGKAQTPVLEVKSGDLTLNANGEYTVRYDGDLTNAGTVTVTVTAAGNNFEGEQTITFEIAKATIESVTVSGEYTYNGAAQNPVLIVKSNAASGSIILAEGDYEVQFTSDIFMDGNVLKNAGTVKLIVTAKVDGNFDGSANTTFVIAKAKVTVTADDIQRPEGESQAQLTYSLTGKFFEPEREEIEGKIALSVDQQVTTAKAGEHFDIVVSLEGKEGYTNYDITLKNGTYTIIDAVFKNVVISDETADYDGQKHNLKVTGYPEGSVVSLKVDGTDFDGAKDAGEYVITVKITYQQYKAYEQTRTLTINKKAVSVTINPQTFTYNGEVQNVVNSSDNYVIPADAIVSGDEIVITLTGSGKDKGQYDIHGSASGSSIKNYNITFIGGNNALTINAAAFSSIDIDEKEFVFNRQAHTPSVTVMWNGKKVDAEENYDVKFDKNTEVGEATITVTGKGNFEGCVLTTNFTITAATIDKAIVTSSHEYNGEEHTPELSVSAGDVVLLPGEFNAVCDRKAIDAGEFTVTVTSGSKNFTGSTTVKFTITKKRVSVTLNEQTTTYNGEAQTPTSQKDKDYTADGVIDDDDLELVISVAQQGECINAGRYALTATCGNDNYDITIDGSANFVIEAEKLTIVLKAQSATYSGAEPTVSQTEYEITVGTVYDGDDLGIKISKDSGVGAGTYNITATWNNTENYDVTLDSENGKFTITKATITVSVGDLSSTYGESLVDLKQAVSVQGIVDGDVGSVDIWRYIDVTSDAVNNVASDNYKITVTTKDDDLANYTIAISGEGKYTVLQREVTVTIRNQHDVYGFNKTYEVDQKAWDVTAGNVLANDDLGITLVKDEGTDAGEYDIHGSANNANYKVTFVEGKYTISKLDVSDTATFTLTVGGKSGTGNVIHAKYEGSELALLGVALIFETDEPKSLDVTLTVGDDAASSISAMGDYTVVLTINDKNYSGSATYTVIVADAKGYTQNLYNVLDKLESLRGDLVADDLAADDFEVMKSIVTEIANLDEDEKLAAAADLKPYNDLIEAWNSLAKLDENVIKTAQSVADFPLGTLFEIAAAASALLALAYIAMKGVKLI